MRRSRSDSWIPSKRIQGYCWFLFKVCHSFPGYPASGVRDVIDNDNPYAAPKAEVLVQDRHLDSSSKAWRDRKLLVVRKGAELTDRCLKCAAPTEGYRFSRKLSWHKPIWFLLFFLISPIVYIIVYFFVRWQGWVTVSLCPRHRRNRAWAIALGWLAALAGAGLIVPQGPLSQPKQQISLIAGIVLFFVGVIGGIGGSQVLIPRRMDRHFVWLSKVSPAYLAELPDWNA
jgi:hypothetical protein